jgi:hypothetical protein
LAEQIMVKSGDAALAQSGRLFTPDIPHDRDVPYIGRRESTESIMSNTSATFVNHLIAEPESMVPRDRRTALVAPASGARRPSFGLVSEDEPETKGDPGMRGMEVLAESARRVADAERKDSMEDDQPAGSPAKPSGGSTGPKYPCQYCKKAFTRPSSLRIHTYSRAFHSSGIPLTLQIQASAPTFARTRRVDASSRSSPTSSATPRCTTKTTSSTMRWATTTRASTLHPGLTR